MPNFHNECSRLMINNSLDEGTQLPYIRKALGLGYGVVVLNTNDNKPVEVGSVEIIYGGCYSNIKPIFFKA